MVTVARMVEAIVVAEVFEVVIEMDTGKCSWNRGKVVVDWTW